MKLKITNLSNTWHRSIPETSGNNPTFSKRLSACTFCFIRVQIVPHSKEDWQSSGVSSSYLLPSFPIISAQTCWLNMLLSHILVFCSFTTQPSLWTPLAASTASSCVFPTNQEIPEIARHWLKGKKNIFYSQHKPMCVGVLFQLCNFCSHQGSY